MVLYKIINNNRRRACGLTWGPGVTHRLPHGHLFDVYRSPLLAALMNPAHEEFDSMHLWEADGEVVNSTGYSIGVNSLTTIREVPLPEVTTTQRVAFAILAVRAAASKIDWCRWADGWISGYRRGGDGVYSVSELAMAASNAAEAADYAAVSEHYLAAKEAADAAMHAAQAYRSFYNRECSLDLCPIAEEAMKYM